MRAYQDKQIHSVIQSNKCECDNMENMETYSEEVEVGKKKVKITLEFPYTVDPSDAARFEYMLKEIYLNKIKIGSVQRSLNAVSFPTLKGQCESSSHDEKNSQGGMNHE